MARARRNNSKTNDVIEECIRISLELTDNGKSHFNDKYKVNFSSRKGWIWDKGSILDEESL